MADPNEQGVNADGAKPRRETPPEKLFVNLKRA
jgi:hypothetical protein